MSDLFIPPEGTMQMHVTHDSIHDKRVDFVVWVMPPIPRNDTYPLDCSCPVVYPVVRQSIRGEVVKQGGRNNSNPNLCLCAGRIIE